MAAPARDAKKSGRRATDGAIEIDDPGELLLEPEDEEMGANELLPAGLLDAHVLPEDNLQTSEDLCRALARRLIERMGLREAAEQIGIKPDALARFVAGARSHRGTVKLVEDGLKRGGK